MLLGFTANTQAIELGQSLEFRTTDFHVKVLTYLHKPASLKSIIIVPPTGGTNFLDRSYAKTFFKAGFNVYILDRWKDDDEYNLELEIHQRFYSRAQSAIDLTLSKIQSPFVGILGTSVGALHTAVAMGRIERLNAAFVITGGMTIPEVVANSDQIAMVDAKKKRFEMFGFKSVQNYVEALDRVLDLDPSKLPPLFQGKPLGMVIAKKDTTVPGENQIKLKKLWNPELVIESRFNHMMAIITTWLFEDKKILEFFQAAARK